MGLNLNPIKTTLIAFTKKRKLNLDHPVKLNGVVLEWKQEIKYLGITLDRKLLWNKHAELVESKAKRALMACRNLAGKAWGFVTRKFCLGCIP